MIVCEKINCIVTWIDDICDYKWEGPMTRTKADHFAMEVATNPDNTQIKVCLIIAFVQTSPHIVGVED